MVLATAQRAAPLLPPAATGDGPPHTTHARAPAEVLRQLMASGNTQLVQALQASGQQPWVAAPVPQLSARAAVRPHPPRRPPAAAACRLHLNGQSPPAAPLLLPRLQRSLNGMVGQSSGFIEGLPAPVRTRIEYLKELDGERAELHDRYRWVLCWVGRGCTIATGGCCAGRGGAWPWCIWMVCVLVGMWGGWGGEGAGTKQSWDAVLQPAAAACVPSTDAKPPAPIPHAASLLVPAAAPNREERRALEEKYDQLYTPLYTRRSAVVNGAAEAPENETGAASPGWRAGGLAGCG